MIVPDPSKLKSNQFWDKHIKLVYPEFYEFIYNKYPFISKISEGMYLYFNNLDKPPVCKNCGKSVEFMCFSKGYREFCCNKCAHTEENKLKTQQTNLERYGHICNLHNPKIHEQVVQNWIDKYGEDNPAKSKEIQEKTKQTNLEKYGTITPLLSERAIEKSKCTCLEKYGVERYQNSEEFKKHIKEIHDIINEKVRKTCLERYGCESYLQTEESKRIFKEKKEQILETRRKTFLKHFGADCYVHSKKYKEDLEEINRKKYFTYKKNNSFNKSSIEKRFEEWLKDNNIKYKSQYRSDKYPFHCDFYFPDLDLYFEINGHWSHGGHKFNKNSKEDIEKLNKWKSKNTQYYYNAIKTWTDLDIRKYDIAKQNKLYYIVVYSNKLEDIIDIYIKEKERK